MLRFGNGIGEIINSSWKDEVNRINIERINNEKKLELLKTELLNLKPDFIAVGHGYCVNCSEDK